MTLHLQPLLWFIYGMHTEGVDGTRIRNDHVALDKRVDVLDYRRLVDSTVNLGRSAGDVPCNESVEDALRTAKDTGSGQRCTQGCIQPFMQGCIKDARMLGNEQECVRGCIFECKDVCKDARPGCESSQTGPADIRQAHQREPDGYTAHHTDAPELRRSGAGRRAALLVELLVAPVATAFLQRQGLVEIINENASGDSSFAYILCGCGILIALLCTTSCIYRYYHSSGTYTSSPDDYRMRDGQSRGGFSAVAGGIRRTDASQSYEED